MCFITNCDIVERYRVSCVAEKSWELSALSGLEARVNPSLQSRTASKLETPPPSRGHVTEYPLAGSEKVLQFTFHWPELTQVFG